MASQYRYSRDSFNRTVLTAIGLTVIVSFLVWLFSRLFGLRHAELITLISGMIFFGFCSAYTLWHYFNRSVVLAIRPDGLFDVRYSSQAVPWDDIKEMRLGRAENDFQLGIYLWPGVSKKSHHSSTPLPAFTIDLAPLDASVQQIVDSLSRYKHISLEER